MPSDDEAPTHTLSTNVPKPQPRKRKRTAPRLFSRPRKQSRQLEPEDALPPPLSDTQVALHTLQASWPNEARQLLSTTPPILFKSQLRALLSDLPALERELSRLVAAHQIAHVRVPNGDDAYVFIADWLEKCPHELSRRFVRDIVPLCETIVPRGLLSELDEEHITQLVQEGFLTMRDEGGFWLAIPGMGEVLQQRRLGNKELMGIVKRAKYAELPKSVVEQRTLKKTCMTALWHLRDLVGSDALYTVETSIGPLVRLRD